jgi:hypothetical protein
MTKGKGHYGLIDRRKLLEIILPAREDGDGNDASMVKLRKAMKFRDAIQLLEDAGLIDWEPNIFFAPLTRDDIEGPLP